jgi:hypothetical protein
MNWYGQERQWHIGYFDVMEIIDFHLQPAQPPTWQQDTACQFKTPEAPGELTTWLTFSPATQPAAMQHIAFVDNSGTVQALFQNPSVGWSLDPVTATSGSPALPDALTSWVLPQAYSTQHVAYIDSRGHVEEVVKVLGQGWGIRDVTDDIGASSSGSGPHWAQPGALTFWLSFGDGLQHVAYIDQRGHIQDCYMHPGQYPWAAYDVTDDTGTPAQAGALTSWWFVGDGAQHIAFIDNNTDVIEAFVQPGKPPWQTRTVLRAGSLGPASPAS